MEKLIQLFKTEVKTANDYKLNAAEIMIVILIIIAICCN